ncbi:nucleotidyltransferase domain-containing protein [Micromonospora sp. WMMD710]|uniref:DNA polymerase beta superfamily protein n=1 Tax=Micromonospora sp. WMMD710 TaxID=3016085 RepID=UPI00241712B0|nr:nucleotidyltransferase domain-containing protein [Micromonospora sp. WMMD710]MDG4759085.1 nucleotidyltransferase domain-containing protein [Micromonospora sp. WMMD710]
MTLDVPPWAAEVACGLPRPLLFATVSGAHLYGFASVDSDLDLRAAHLLAPAEVVGLRTGPQTLQHAGVRDGVELDVVSHDLLKFATLLLYTLRVLLTGIHLMRTGHLETDLNVLGTGLAYVPDLIAAKREAEHGPFPAGAAQRLAVDVPRLRAQLEAARDASTLPEHADPAAVAALHDLVVRTRLG